jgi:chaperonin GroEL
MQYQKAKSVSKQVQARGPALDRTILETMKTISNIVGATLGPGGRQVLIERQEEGLPPMVTKDGVTVFRSLGFTDDAAHCIMEAARDASVRTASEAGDGTTTATILSEAIVRLAKEYSDKNPKVSPQRIVRRLERAFREVIEPTVKKLSVKADMTTESGQGLLRKVATISANGDTELANAVIECFRLVGDDGNVTIAESTGPSKYEVERIDGFPIAQGYEVSAAKFYPKFINDPANQRVLLERPAFLIYHGRINDPQSLFGALNKIGSSFEAGEIGPNVVLAATGFSEAVLGWLGKMFEAPNALNVFPLLAPQSPFANGQLDFLLDLAAVTGTVVYDPLNSPLDTVEIATLGKGVMFESYRFRSNVIGTANEDELLLRIDHLKTQLDRAESQLDTIVLQERIAKLTGGIARLKVIGASNGELKEKRDRAEDAVCAVRGAIRSGCLPGGCWTLLRLAHDLRVPFDPVIDQVLIPALYEPFNRLLENVGIPTDDEEFKNILDVIYKTLVPPSLTFPDGTASDLVFSLPTTFSLPPSPMVYDALNGSLVDAFEAGILDSTPAVLEAIRNSLSIASLLGTLGGTVVFKRDLEVERREARDMHNFVRDANRSEADERY